MRIEEGKYKYKGHKLNIVLTARYIPYYSEEKQQWYLVDFGWHRLWLSWFSFLAPLFYRYVKLKAYRIDEEYIKELKDNAWCKYYLIFIEVLCIMVLPELRHERRSQILFDKSTLHFNSFLVHHLKLSIFFGIIFALGLLCMYGMIKLPHINNNYEYLNIKMRLNIKKNKKKFLLVLFTTVMFLTTYFGIFLLGIRYIGVTVLFISCYLDLYTAILNSPFSDLYIGKFIFEN